MLYVKYPIVLVRLHAVNIGIRFECFFLAQNILEYSKISNYIFGKKVILTY